MSKFTTPIRIDRNRIYLLDYGMLTIPSGISLHLSPKSGRRYIRVNGLSRNVYKHVYVENQVTAAEWIDYLETAIDHLEELRGRMLVGNPLRRKEENGPIPGKGQPGIFYVKGKTDIKVYDPLERVAASADSLPDAISMRLGFEHNFYLVRTFHRSDMFPE